MDTLKSPRRSYLGENLKAQATAPAPSMAIPPVATAATLEGVLLLVVLVLVVLLVLVLALLVLVLLVLVVVMLVMLVEVLLLNKLARRGEVVRRDGVSFHPALTRPTSGIVQLGNISLVAPRSG